MPLLNILVLIHLRDNMFKQNRPAEFKKLGIDPLNSGSRLYPLDLESRNEGHAILFNIYDVEGASAEYNRANIQSSDFSDPEKQRKYSNLLNSDVLKEGSKSLSDTRNNLRKVNITGNLDAIATGVADATLSAGQKIIDSTLQFQQTTSLLKDSIMLYMPAKVGGNYSFGWDNFDLQGFRALAKGGSAALSGIAGAINGVTNLDASGVMDSLSNMKSLEFLRYFGTEMIAGTIENFLGGRVPVESALEAFTRQVNLSYNQYAFKSVDLRKFQFDFNFAPRSQAEASVVHEIIYLFKKYGHPAIRTKNNTHGFFVDYPAEFQITFLTLGGHQNSDGTGWIENTWINRISRCVLTGIQVDYTAHGEGFVGHPISETTTNGVTTAGSSPIQTAISMSFDEIELLTRDKIEDGY